jgi:hypothetical protein
VYEAKIVRGWMLVPVPMLGATDSLFLAGAGSGAWFSFSNSSGADADSRFLFQIPPMPMLVPNLQFGESTRTRFVLENGLLRIFFNGSLGIQQKPKAFFNLCPLLLNVNSLISLKCASLRKNFFIY